MRTLQMLIMYDKIKCKSKIFLKKSCKIKIKVVSLQCKTKKNTNTKNNKHI